ncbi:MAG: cell division protein FtsL [Treponema sp.]|nr:cell division protein FtsL [Treponema sp.]
MIKKYLLLYVLVLSIPLCLGLLVWQSNRYKNLANELKRLEQTQAEWIESNKKLIAGISEYSSVQRIENIAKNELNLRKIPPEYYLQVKITEGKGHGH